MPGPLHGVRVLELAGLGPAPFAAMMLADQGAEVVRIGRPQGAGDLTPRPDVLQRSRRQLALDLKHPEGLALLLTLVARADILLEGFRPGVMERLGAGPEACLARNPRLVYGRMTGWGQTGPLAQSAGHDLNYIALAGALAHIGRPEGGPVPPLNLVGDFGGGGMLLAFGVMSALLEAQRSGQGQVVDAAMIDGAAALMAMFWGWSAAGLHDPARRGDNLLDGGAPFYDTYACADGSYVAIAALEPHFYAQLLQRLGLAGDPDFAAQMDRSRWPVCRARLRALFLTRTRAEWCEALEGTDTCFAPVLTMSEAPQHPHHQARGTFCEVDGLPQPAPAPRYSRSALESPRSPAPPGQHTREVLLDWGVPAAAVEAALQAGAAHQA